MVDLNVFVDVCVIESLPALLAEADISHLHQTRGLLSMFIARTGRRGETTWPVSAPPSPTSWDLLETSLDAAPGASVEPPDLGPGTAEAKLRGSSSSRSAQAS